MATARLSGTIAAAVTPLRDEGRRLDDEALVALLTFYAEAGLQGVLVLGTTGEGILMKAEERRRVAELAASAVGDLGVIVHCGAQTTAATASLAGHAAEAGADGVAVIAPPYFRFDAAELEEHFATAASACQPLPFYVYEYAERSGYSVPVTVIERLRERVPNLVGMKVSDAPFERVSPYLRCGLDVFVGAEALIPAGLDQGAVGAVSGVAAAFPEAVSALVREPTDERADVVRALRNALSEQRFQASVKVALGLRGVPVREDVRAPLQPLDTAARTRLRDELGRLLGSEIQAPSHA